ncbi:hypothetical protein ACIU1J_32225 [Azospirillum doebereinerae]|uniref:hypothetical protein n=1 Tax=Azospirillum doebereinerae TaxID=92933 RepID=UPI001EE5C293|nr:hypothetical protein [Azospirillum doebereinerae]MCG5238391.1 hypothetical protein [Azospirillum doebereinerae]
MIVMTEDDACDYRVGYRAGWEAVTRGVTGIPAEYYGWGWWRRIGYVISCNDCDFHDADFQMAGEHARSLDLPVAVNPWLPDEDGHAPFLNGWLNAQPAGLRWAVAP